jgi:hypothetical protein
MGFVHGFSPINTDYWLRIWRIYGFIATTFGDIFLIYKFANLTNFRIYNDYV